VRASTPVSGGRLPPQATVLGLGGGPLGGLFAPVSEETAHAIVERAWGHGIRLFDVAPLYGHGRSERFVGDVLRAKPRGEFVLSTKVGRLLRAEAAGERSDFAETEGVGPVFDFSRDGVRRSLEESLERLGLDRVDVVYLHDPESHLEQALSDGCGELERLRDEGVVRAIGVGTNSASTLARFARETAIDCALLAGRLTLLDHADADEALALCVERGISVVAGGVFNSGLLADPRGAATTFDYRSASDRMRARARALDETCRNNGVDLKAAAIQFPLRRPAVAAVLVGVRDVAELDADVAAFEAEIPPALWSIIAPDDAGTLQRRPRAERGDASRE
jgi:D-threo-aldose 1-dehydrogenase